MPYKILDAIKRKREPFDTPCSNVRFGDGALDLHLKRNETLTWTLAICLEGKKNTKYAGELTGHAWYLSSFIYMYFFFTLLSRPCHKTKQGNESNVRKSVICWRIFIKLGRWNLFLHTWHALHSFFSTDVIRILRYWRDTNTKSIGGNRENIMSKFSPCAISLSIWRPPADRRQGQDDRQPLAPCAVWAISWAASIRKLPCRLQVRPYLPWASPGRPRSAPPAQPTGQKAAK